MSETNTRFGAFAVKSRLSRFGRERLVMIGLSCVPITPSALAEKPGFAHQSRYPVATDSIATITQRLSHPRAAVAALGLTMDRS